MAVPAEGRIRASALIVVMIRGVLAIVLGLASAALLVLGVLFPRVTASVLALLFGAYALLDGVLTLALCARAPGSYRPWLILQGVIDLGVGAAMLGGFVELGPRLLRLVGLWAIATGVVELIVAREVHRKFASRTPMVSGALSLLFGVVILAGWPGTGLIAFIWLLAAYGLLTGFVGIAAAAR